MLRGEAVLVLMTTTLFDDAGVRVRLRVGLEPSFTAFGVERRGVVYDGAYSPVSHAPSRGRVAFQILLRGYLKTSTGLRADEPALFRMREDVLEGADGSRPATVRTGGDHLMLGLHVAPEWVRGDRLAPPERLALDPELERRARHAMASFGAGQSSVAVAGSMHDVVRRLGELGLIDPAIRSTFDAEGYGARLWNAFATFFSDLDASPSLTRLTDLVNVSPRHADRLLARFTEAYGLPDEGFRAVTRRWRLKLATLLLSSPALSVERVARLVGYASPEALATAMAAERLLAPSRYRRLVQMDEENAEGSAA